MSLCKDGCARVFLMRSVSHAHAKIRASGTKTPWRRRENSCAWNVTVRGPFYLMCAVFGWCNSIHKKNKPACPCTRYWSRGVNFQSSNRIQKGGFWLWKDVVPDKCPKSISLCRTWDFCVSRKFIKFFVWSDNKTNSAFTQWFAFFVINEIFESTKMEKVEINGGNTHLFHSFLI